MSDSNPRDHTSSLPPRNTSVLPTAEERQAEEARQREIAEKIAEINYKERQVAMQEAANGLARSNKKLTFALVICTAATVGVGIYQGRMNHMSWVASSASIEEMQREDQGNSQQFQVQLNRYEATMRETHEIAKQTFSIAIASQKSAKAAQDSVDATREQLELTQRPRLSIDINNSGDLTFVRDSTNTKDLALVPNMLVYHNSGQTPALILSFHEELAPDMSTFYQTEQSRSVHDSCLKRARNNDVLRSINSGAEWPHPGTAMAVVDSTQSATFFPMLTACVAYRSSFSRKIYHSEVSYAFFLRNNGTIPFGKTTPMGALEVREISGSRHSDEER